MPAKLTKLTNQILHIISQFILLMLFTIFAFSGAALGALKTFESQYAEKVFRELKEAELFSCHLNPTDEVTFISDHCPTHIRLTWTEDLLRSQFPNISLLNDNTTAILESIKDLDIPDLPQISELPEYQGLIDLVEASRELEPLSFSNLRDYGSIALEFIEYFSQNGAALLDFLTSNTIANVTNFFDQLQQTYLTAEQAIGYVDVLTDTNIPIGNMIKYALIGLVLGGLSFTFLFIILRFLVKSITQRISRLRRKPKDMKTESDEKQDLARRDREFDKLVKRNKKK